MPELPLTPAQDADAGGLGWGDLPPVPEFNPNQFDAMEPEDRRHVLGRHEYHEPIACRPCFGFKMPWGRHRGKRLHVVPLDYLEWAANTFDNIRPELREAMVDRFALAGRLDLAAVLQAGREEIVEEAEV